MALIIHDVADDISGRQTEVAGTWVYLGDMLVWRPYGQQQVAARDLLTRGHERKQAQISIGERKPTSSQGFEGDLGGGGKRVERGRLKHIKVGSK